MTVSPLNDEKSEGSPSSHFGDCIAGIATMPLTERLHDSRTHSLFGRGLGNGMGVETPTAICFISCVAGATEGVTRKAAIESLAADRRTAGDP